MAARLRSVPLRRWIITLFLSSTLVSAGLIFATAWWLGNRTIRQQSVNELREIANQLLVPIRRTLEHGQPENLPALISTVIIRPDVDLVAVSDEDGRIIAASHYAWVGRPVSDFIAWTSLPVEQQSGGILDVRRRPEGLLARERIDYVSGENGLRHAHHATLWVGLDTHAMRGIVLHQALAVAGLLVAAGLILAAILFQLTRRYISRPFGRLAAFAQRLASGNLQERLEVKGSGEAADLAQSLHQMAARLAHIIDNLHEHEKRLSVTLDSIGDAVIVTDERGLVTRMNAEAERLTGWRDEEAYGRPLTEIFQIISTLTREPAVDPVGRVLREGKVVGLANHTSLIARDGTEYQIADSAAPIRAEAGTILGVILVFHDVTEQYAARARLSRLARQLQDLTRALPDPVFIMDHQGRYLEIHGGSPRLLVRNKEALLGRTVEEVLPEGTARTILETIRVTLQENHPQLIEYQLEVPAGLRHFEGHCAPYHGLDEAAVVWVARDITRRKRAEEQASRLALYDPLTGLPNRRLFMARLEQAVARARRIGDNGALLFIDLDRFKTINDSLGHLTGDRVLRAVAERMRPLLRAEDLASRLGGDEFVVLLEDLGPDPIRASEHAEKVAEKLRAAFDRPIEVGNERLHIGFSAGIVLFPDKAGPEELIKRADIAMYRAKETGRGRVCFFSREFQTIAEERLRIQRDLLQAIEEDQLELHVQPVVNPQGRWRGGEVLVRWRHPKRGLLAPAAFIGIAEESGIITQLDRKVIATAIRGLAGEAVPDDFVGLSLNLSGPLMLEEGFTGEIEGWLRSAGLPAHYLEMEITERLLLADQGTAVKVINTLRDLGIRFAVDDFGTGYSSLRYLQRLPLDRLKIDHSFVSRLPGHQGDATIVETIIAMAQHLALEVVAEGVEHEAQLDFLAERGCRRFQGFYFEKPMPWKRFFNELPKRI